MGREVESLHAIGVVFLEKEKKNEKWIRKQAGA
jgi:hypothetical protein